VAHSEIILPENAPPEYADRQTLWNAVEKNEKRKDAQLSREIIVALPKELNLEEQISVMRQYIKENFVKKGMIADFSIHHNEKNPHAHIMLTMRNVSRNGFGLKNTDWNKKENLLSYRKAWTHIINNTLERKGLAERIDHRTLKEQGIDREPTIHMGHAATALERQGIHTKKGDYNREIKRRQTENLACGVAITTPECGVTKLTNIERAKKEAEFLKEIHEEIREMHQNLKALQQQIAAASSEPEPNETITKLKTANRVNELPESLTISDNQQSPPPRYPEMMYNENLSVVKMGQRSAKLRGVQLTTAKDLRVLRGEREEDQQEIQRLAFRIKKIGEDAKNIQTLNAQLTQLQAEYRSLRNFLDWKHKRELKREIKRAEGDIRAALFYFDKNYHIAPDKAPVEIALMQEQKQKIESALDTRNIQIAKLAGKLHVIEQVRRNHNFKIKRNVEQQQPSERHDTDQPERTQTHGIERRRSVTRVMKELRKEFDEETRRRRRRKALARKEPIKMYEIKPLPQKRLHRDDYYVKRTKNQSIERSR